MNDSEPISVRRDLLTALLKVAELNPVLIRIISKLAPETAEIGADALANAEWVIAKTKEKLK